MYKRGQATIFIIIGIVVLFVVVGLLIFREQLFMNEWERAQAQALLIPDEAQEIHTYVSSCIEDVTLEPLVLIGLQGGYINIPDDPIPSSGQNTFSNNLQMFDGGDLRTAYWFYEAANGVEKEQIPTKEEMEQEIADYVNENLARCVDEDDVLLNQYNVDAGEIFTEVEILDDSVHFIVNYPLHIEVDEFSFDYPAFYIEQEVPLGKMYDSAVEVMNSENEDFVFEELTYDMIVLYEDIPDSWTDFECEKKEWDLEEVEEEFKKVLLNNILAVKIKGTSYSTNTASDKGYFELDLIDNNVNYNANVLYSPNWPLSIDAYPLEDGKLVEDSYTDSGVMGAFLRSLFCLHSYNFVYDIKYPLLISLYDETSDYTFQFATMVIIDNNQPRENVLGTLDYSDDSVVCDSLTEEMTVYALEVSESGELIELADADVSYRCVSSECNIGKTSGVKGSASLDALFPTCMNGQLIAEKEGYYKGEEIVSTLDADTASVILEKLYNLDYEIKIVGYNGDVRSPTTKETVYLTLTEEEGYVASAYYPTDDNQIELIPGSYSLYGTLIKENGLDISVNGKQFEKCVSVPMKGIAGIFGLEKDECYNVDLADVNLDSYMTGGVEMQWETDRNAMDSASKIIFYITEAGEPEEVDDLADVYSSFETGIGMVEPEFE
ncbi:MAG: hypothetical protein ABIJ18_00225 [archaeon]